MHNWHSRTSTNIQHLIDHFIGYRMDSDSCNDEVIKVIITDVKFKSEAEARAYVTNRSYGGSSAYVATVTTKNSLTKGYQTAYNNFIGKRNDYVNFKKELNIGYKRTSSKVTCPNCSSSINLFYGRNYTYCPVCGSKKIISDSNWKTLETKKKLAEKAAETLSSEAQKNGVTFVCGIEWHS